MSGFSPNDAAAAAAAAGPQDPTENNHGGDGAGAAGAPRPPRIAGRRLLRGASDDENANAAVSSREDDDLLLMSAVPPYSLRELSSLINLSASLANFSEIERHRCEDALNLAHEAGRKTWTNLRWRMDLIRRLRSNAEVRGDDDDDEKTKKTCDGGGEANSNKKRREARMRDRLERAIVPVSYQGGGHREMYLLEALQRLWSYHGGKVEGLFSGVVDPAWTGPDGMFPTDRILFQPHHREEAQQAPSPQAPSPQAPSPQAPSPRAEEEGEQSNNTHATIIKGGREARRPPLITKCRYNTHFENDIGVPYFRRFKQEEDNNDSRSSATMARNGRAIPGRVLGFSSAFPECSCEERTLYEPLPYSVAITIKEGLLESRSFEQDANDSMRIGWDHLDFCYYSDLEPMRESSPSSGGTSTTQGEESEAMDEKECKGHDNKRATKITQQDVSPSTRSQEDISSGGKLLQTFDKPTHMRRNSAPGNLDWEENDDEEWDREVTPEMVAAVMPRRAKSFNDLGKAVEFEEEEYDEPWDQLRDLMEEPLLPPSTSPPFPRKALRTSYVPAGRHMIRTLAEEIEKARMANPIDVESSPSREFETYSSRCSRSLMAASYNAALCRHRMGEDDLALTFFRKARANVRGGLGGSGADGGSSRMREWDGTAEDFPRTPDLKDVATQMISAQAAMNMGQIHAYLGRRREAKSFFSEALRDATAAFKLAAMCCRRPEVFAALCGGGRKSQDDENDDGGEGSPRRQSQASSSFAAILTQAVRCVALAFSNLGRMSYATLCRYSIGMTECHNAVEVLVRFLDMFPLDFAPGSSLALPRGMEMAIKRDVSSLLEKISLVQRRAAPGLEQMSPVRAFHFVAWTCLGLPPSFTHGLVKDLDLRQRFVPPPKHASMSRSAHEAASTEQPEGRGRKRRASALDDSDSPDSLFRKDLRE